MKPLTFKEAENILDALGEAREEHERLYDFLDDLPYWKIELAESITIQENGIRVFCVEDDYWFAVYTEVDKYENVEDLYIIVCDEAKPEHLGRRFTFFKRKHEVKSKRNE